MTNEITVEMLDRKIAWCKQMLEDDKAADIQCMQDFYFEKTRDSMNDDWPESFTLQELAQALGMGLTPVRYRIYYSQDNLTLRLFVFRPQCTSAEMETMLGMGFVFANDGDTENIPNKPVDYTEGKQE
jgi:hypothetical protein